VKSHHGTTRDISVYGQEYTTTYTLAKKYQAQVAI